MSDEEFLKIISELSDFGLSHVKIMFKLLGNSKEKVKTLIFLMRNNDIGELDRPSTSDEAFKMLNNLRIPDPKVFTFFGRSSPDKPIYDPKIKR